MVPLHWLRMHGLRHLFVFVFLPISGYLISLLGKSLKKKLAQNLAIALHALNNNGLATAAGIALDYYDKYYETHLEKNKSRIQQTFHFEKMDIDLISNKLLQKATV